MLKQAIVVIVALGFISSCSSEDPSKYLISDASYEYVDAEVGCKSKYSDEKKEDFFNDHFKNVWMTWSGEVVLAETGEAALNIDGFGTQDLAVDFADPKAGYDLQIGQQITVQFVMKRAGGCFLPFSGKYAVIK